MTVTLEPLPHPPALPDALQAHGIEADAGALFRERSEPRNEAAGDARSHARTCPNCRGVIPAGMSLCDACGFDIETGRISTTLDVLPEEVETPSRPEMGTLAFLTGWGSLGLGTAWIAAGTLLMNAEPLAIALLVSGALVCYCAILYLSRRSYKRLMFALGFMAVCGLVLLVAAPIFQASAVAGASTDAGTTGFMDRLNSLRLLCGLVGVVAAVGFMLYLMADGERGG